MPAFKGVGVPGDETGGYIPTPVLGRRDGGTCMPLNMKLASLKFQTGALVLPCGLLEFIIIVNAIFL